MPDALNKEQRSALMSRIRGTNTGTERTIFRLLRREGIYFARHARNLAGSPDVVFRKCRLAVFIDGDFWHGRNFARWSRGLSPFWSAKIRKNMARDRKARARLRAEGWAVLRLWSKDSIGLYVAGRSYNPRYPLRTAKIHDATARLDAMLKEYEGDSRGKETTIDFILEVLRHCQPDPDHGAELWDPKPVGAALEKLKSLNGDRAYLVVRRGRSLNEPRRETQGIISGGEETLAPDDAPTLFLYRQDANRKGEAAVWWPQLRFPEGNYVLAFSFNR